MRNKEARIISDFALVMCPICQWFTDFRGGKVKIQAEVKKHLRQEHTQAEAREYLE